jgi:hypothetical protein
MSHPAQATTSPGFVPSLGVEKWLPWVGSLALVAVALSRTDLQGLLQGVRQGRVVAVLLLLGAFSLTSLFLEALFLQVALGRLYRRVPFVPVFRARAAATLLSSINTVAGYGGLVYWFQRRLALPASRGAGVILVEAFHELAAIGILATLGAGLIGAGSGGGPGAETLSQVTWLGAGCTGFALFCVLLSRVPNPWARPDGVLQAFADLRLTDYASLLSIKLVQNTLWGLTMAACLPLFGVRPPVVVSIAFTQLVHLARALPMTVFGIGADQVSISTLFGPWETAGTEGSLLAFSVVFTTAILVFRLGLGLPFAPTVLQETRLPTRELK